MNDMIFNVIKDDQDLKYREKQTSMHHDEFNGIIA